MRKNDHTSISLSPPPPRGLHVGQHMAPPHHLAWPNCWSGSSPCRSSSICKSHKHLCLMRHCHGLELLDHLLHLKDRPKGTVSSGAWSCEKHGKDEMEGRGGTRSKFRTSIPALIIERCDTGNITISHDGRVVQLRCARVQILRTRLVHLGAIMGWGGYELL